MRPLLINLNRENFSSEILTEKQNKNKLSIKQKTTQKRREIPLMSKYLTNYSRSFSPKNRYKLKRSHLKTVKKITVILITQFFSKTKQITKNKLYTDLTRPKMSACSELNLFALTLSSVSNKS